MQIEPRGCRRKSFGFGACRGPSTSGTCDQTELFERAEDRFAFGTPVRASVFDAVQGRLDGRARCRVGASTMDPIVGGRQEPVKLGRGETTGAYPANSNSGGERAGARTGAAVRSPRCSRILRTT